MRQLQEKMVKDMLTKTMPCSKEEGHGYNEGMRYSSKAQGGESLPSGSVQCTTMGSHGKG